MPTLPEPIDRFALQGVTVLYVDSRHQLTHHEGRFLAGAIGEAIDDSPCPYKFLISIEDHVEFTANDLTSLVPIDAVLNHHDGELAVAHSNANALMGEKSLSGLSFFESVERAIAHLHRERELPATLECPSDWSPQHLFKGLHCFEAGFSGGTPILKFWRPDSAFDYHSMRSDFDRVVAGLNVLRPDVVVFDIAPTAGITESNLWAFILLKRRCDVINCEVTFCVRHETCRQILQSTVQTQGCRVFSTLNSALNWRNEG